jgi:hypothetical protein
MNRYILTVYNISDTITINGYYIFTDTQCQEILDWYEDFTESIFVVDNITITPDNFSIMEIEYDFNCEKFIEKYGNPCNILEHIDEISHIMDSDYARLRNGDLDDEDLDLCIETENFNKLINAHLSENYEEVQRLILEKDYDEDDDIIKKIIKKYDK